MKHLIVLAFSLISAGVFAQSSVIKMSATKTSNYGVEYYLPKTVLTVEAKYSKTTEKAGIYAKYAERLLGLDSKKIVQEDGIHYSLDKIDVKSKGIPDRKEGYLIEFKTKTVAPFVCLTEDGLICTVNADYTPAFPIYEETKSGASAKSGLSVESVFTEEYMRAGSTLKMAEAAARQIFQIRDSRNDLLTGNAENAPRDGEGLKLVLNRLEEQEKALTELFTGYSSTETLEAEYEIEPQGETEKEVLFRFSKYEGLVDGDDLSGSPVYFNIKRIEEELPQPKTEEVKKGKKSKEIEGGIMYNVPAKAEVEVFFGLSSYFKNTFQIVQLGRKQMLAPSLLVEDKKAPIKIYFYPETGAIKQIIQ